MLTSRGPSLRPTARLRVGGLLGAVAAIAAIGITAQACGVSPMGGDSMDGRMNGGMMDGGGRYPDASAAPVVGTAPVVRVRAGDMYFDPARLRIDAGTTINLTLENDGAAFHDLTIPAADFVLAADPATKTSGSLTIVEPGTYDFLCSVPGHARAGMTGTLLVE